MGWGIRKIARELGLSCNTVRAYARSVEVLSAEALAEEILKGSPPSSTIETDPLSTPAPQPFRIKLTHFRTVSGRFPGSDRSKSLELNSLPMSVTIQKVLTFDFQAGIWSARRRGGKG
jgi:hypothetical protein